MIKLKDLLTEKREYFIDTSKDDTTRYVIKDGDAYYVGKTGVKGGNIFLKFTWHSVGKINLRKLKKLSSEKKRKFYDIEKIINSYGFRLFALTNPHTYDKHSMNIIELPTMQFDLIYVHEEKYKNYF